jgi:Tol biopolymer transport system component
MTGRAGSLGAIPERGGRFVSLESGARLGPYQIEGPAGAGGMGEVYRATDTRLERTVAIKVLPPHLSTHAELKQRFEREARTISSLQHPHICALYDVGNEGGVDFLVMEYLEGETLAARLQQGPLPPETLLPVGTQIAEALHAAHRQGVVHRDLKPGNVMLTRTGAKLLDFGLARMAEGGTAATESSLTQLATQQRSEDPLTERGTVLGTFQYMSPEQLEGTEADARSDIFALGAVLYEMATGTRAFEGKSQASLIASIMQSQPAPMSSVQPMTPPALERVVRTCLEKDADDRWQTAHDVALQLKWIEEGGSQLGVPAPVAARRRSRERVAWVVAAVAGIAAIALAANTLLAPAPEAPASVRFAVEAPSSVASFGSPRISPDGRHIAFNGIDSTGGRAMWVRPLNAIAMRKLAGTEACGRPFWSPDGKHIGFFADGKLKRVPAAGGLPLTLCEFASGSDGAWGSTGVILFDGQTGDSINAVPAGGGTVYGATRIDRERGETGHGWPAFLPDGERFVYIAFREGQPAEMRLGKLGAFDTAALTAVDSRIEYVPPGYLIFERGNTLLAQPFDAGAGRLSGDPFPLAEGIGTGDVGLAHFSGSNDGTLIFTSGDAPERQLVWFDRTGRELGTVGDRNPYREPALSPDGRRVAVTVAGTRGASSDIWMIDLVRGVQSRFTFDEATETDALWSPDGSQVAFMSTRGGDADIWVRDAAGTRDARPLVDTPYPTFPNDWSRDGTLLTMSFRGETRMDVMSADLGADTAEVAQVAGRFLEAQGRRSADGQFLAYTSNESDRFEIYVTSFPAGRGKWQVSTNGGTEPMWRGDGRELFYLATDRSLMSVSVAPAAPIEFGVPKKLFDAPVMRSANTRNRYVVTPDGERFLIVALTDRGRIPPVTVILDWTAELKER